MKIASFLHRSDFGGAQWRVVIIGEHLKRYNVWTTVFFPKDANLKYENFLQLRRFPYYRINFRIIRGLGKFFNNLLFIFLLPFDTLRVISFLNKEKYDIVHINGLSNITPVISAKLLNIDILWHLNDSLTPVWFFKLCSLLFRNIYFCAASESVERHYSLDLINKSYLGILSPPVIDSQNYQNVNINFDFDNYFVIGFVGNLLHKKGLTDFILVISEYSKNCSNVLGVIVGDFIESDLKYRESIFKLISKLRANHLLHFVGYSNNVKEILSKFNVLLYPSHSEAAPIVVLQALSVGIPIVATRVGSVPDWFNKVDLPLVNVGDISQMVLELNRIAALNSQQLADYRFRAHEFIKSFSVELIAAKHLSFYEKIIMQSK